MTRFEVSGDGLSDSAIEALASLLLAVSKETSPEEENEDRTVSNNRAGAAPATQRIDKV
ncbi:MAG: hypothetical protein OES79_03340 [Planctomycetota bacterium]|nr:hypothetical protein [Planctomycetota bacterium]